MKSWWRWRLMLALRNRIGASEYDGLKNVFFALSHVIFFQIFTVFTHVSSSSAARAAWETIAADVVTV